MSSSRKRTQGDEEARFSGAFASADAPVGWAGLPGQVPDLPDSVREDFNARNDEDAEFVGERTVREAEEAVLLARERKLVEKELGAADKASLIETYQQELEKAILARQRWVDQRKEYDEVLKELKMKLDEAEERLDAARASRAEQKSHTSMRGMLIVGGGKSSHRDVRHGNILTDLTGVDIISHDDDDADGSTVRTDQTRTGWLAPVFRAFKLFKKFIHSIMYFFNFFGDDVKKISALYGGTLSPFFGFLQATVVLGSMTIIIHSPLLIMQVFKHDTNESRTCGLFNGACWLLYGGFDESLALFYLVVALGSALATLIFSVYNWTKLDRQYQAVRVQNELEGKRRFTKVALAAWDFRLSREKEKATYGGRISRAMEALKVEDDTEAQLRALTPAQKKRIFYWRIVGTVLFIIALAFGWSLIGVTTYYQESIDSYFSELSGGNATVKTVILFVPAIVVNLLGELAPNIIVFITTMEHWPPGVKEKQLTWRLYVSNLVNVAIYVALYYELISAKSLFSKKGEPLVKFDTAQYECKEDQAATSLLILSISDIFVGSALQLLTKLLWPVFQKFVLKRRKYKAEFKVADGVVTHTVSLSLVWMSLVLSPYAALFFPVAMAVRYVTQRVCMLFADIESSGVAEAMSVGVLIMRLFSVTAAVYMVFAFLILCVPVSRRAGCGPFASGTRGLDTLGLGILDVFNPMAIVLLALCIAFVLGVLFKNNRVTALQAALRETVARGGRIVNQLQRDLRRATGQNSVLRSRIEKQRKRQEALKDA